jgi:hypothetical protein
MVETHARMAGSEDPNGGAEEPPPSRGNDTLGYLCDIIQELKHLADRSGQRTLSAILAAALTEARIQNDQLRR